MRIISGRFKGKKLVETASKTLDLRPTTDRNRESLFNILDSNAILKKKSFDLKNALILDLCCGTGSVGFEAISRGAKKCVFIDIDKRHLDLAKKNAHILGITDEVEMFNLDATNLPQYLNAHKFDFIFIDPPYKNDYAKILQSLNCVDIFSKNCLIVVESEKSLEFDFSQDEKIEFLFKKEYGKSSFGFFVVLDS